MFQADYALMMRGRLLISMGELKNAEVLTVSSNDLQTDRKVTYVSTGNRDRRVFQGGDKDAGFLPFYVGLHLHAIDLRRVWLVHIEG